jgi:hypothetical protein
MTQSNFCLLGTLFSACSIAKSQFTISKPQSISRLRKTMDKASLEARQRGLTPEILESILNDDE